MAALDPGQAVGDGVDGAGGVGRIRPAVQPVQTGDVRGGDTVRDQLALREDVWIVDARCGAVEEVRGIDRDVNVVETDRCESFVHQVRADGPDVIERVGLIRPVEVLRRLGGRAVQRLIFEERVVVAAELQTLLVGEVHIAGKRVFALILRVAGRTVVVRSCRCQSRGFGERIGLQNAKAVLAETVRPE